MPGVPPETTPADSTGGVWLWLDDDLDGRPTPPGWRRVMSANEAIAVLATETVDYLSLDHDLGEYAHDGGDGTAVTDWLAEHRKWPARGTNVHSANPIGVQTMLRTIDTYSPYPLGYSRQRGATPPGGWPSVLH